MDERTDRPADGHAAGARALRRALPPALLLVALSAVFVFGSDRDQLHRDAGLSYLTMAVASNLSAEHRFAGIIRQKLDPDGEPEYVTHNRFPIGSYVLVRLAIQPFGDDFPRQVRAATLLMLACFAAAAALAHLSLARLLGRPWIALAATLLACSSYYCLRYADTISVELSTNLFGVMLVFHGMVVFAQEGRFRQLLVKTAIAILLGWHVVGLIAAFALLGQGTELLRTRRAGGGLRALAACARSRYAAYGAFSVLCCALVLGWNVGNEYLALRGGTPLTDLPTVQSMLGRSRLTDGPEHYRADWPTFFRGYLGGIGGTAIPFAAVDRLGLDLGVIGKPVWPANQWFAVPGAAVFAASLAGLRFLPCRMPFAALLLAGWCWAIMFRGTYPYQEFEALFHLGVPLVFFSLVLLGLRRALGRRRAARALPAAALAAAAAFALSAWDMGAVRGDAEAIAREREWAADSRAMRPFTTGRSVLFDPIRWTGVSTLMRISYWLHGGYLEPNDIGSAEEWAAAAPRHDYVVLPVDLGGSLTPGNRRFFLYAPAALDAAYASIAAREPDARSAFEVRLDGRTLTYTRDGCAEDETWPPLFVHAVPLDAGGLPPDRRAAGFEDREYFPGYHGLRFGGRCIARIGLPDEPLAGVRTGQRQGGLPPVWEVSLPVADPAFPRRASTWREAAAAGEPALRGPFDVYRDGRTLTYVRDGCSEADTEPRFFLHVLPLDADDLPEERRRYGSERLTFAFADRGLRYGGTCMAAFALPDYPVLGVRTGQYVSGRPPVWEGGFPLDADAWRDRFEALAAREPALRAAFGVHIEGRTLTYVRDGCSEADTEPRFFLHVVPVDEGDLPEDRRAAGFGNLDFPFADRGLRYGERCMASVGLPDYPAARVRTGQHGGAGEVWAGGFAVPAGE